MSEAEIHQHGTDDLMERRYPPVDILATLALACAVIGGIFMAAHVPKHIPLIMPIVILGTSFGLLAAAAVLLARIQDFAWDKFRLVYKWALMAYILEAGVIGFAFVRDHTQGGSLAVIVGLLVVFAVSVPTTIAYTVARFAKGLDGTS